MVFTTADLRKHPCRWDDFTVVVVPPTAHSAARRDAARVGGATADLRKRQAVVAVVLIIIVVPSPTVHKSVAFEGACMVLTTADLCKLHVVYGWFMHGITSPTVHCAVRRDAAGVGCTTAYLHERLRCWRLQLTLTNVMVPVRPTVYRGCFYLASAGIIGGEHEATRMMLTTADLRKRIVV